MHQFIVLIGSLYALLGKLTDIRRSNLNRLYWIGLSFKQINRMALSRRWHFLTSFLTAWGISTGICVLFKFFVPIALAMNGWFALLYGYFKLIVLVHNQLQKPFKLKALAMTKFTTAPYRVYVRYRCSRWCTTAITYATLKRDELSF